MNRVVHFEIYATNPPETIAFYKQVFGWKIEPWGPPEAEYWHIDTAGGGEVHRLWKAVALMDTPAQSKLRISTLHLKRS